MGERGIGSVLMVCLVLGVLIGQSTASFPSCYKDCFVLCVATPGNSPLICALKCVKNCILHTSPFGNLQDTQYFCKLGCSTTMCTSLSSKQDPGEGKVESCVDSCSETCAIKN
ncbi:thionin-like protein 2 [Durio zibethinus]|uniref:Thionin-like protein 2 n=1 Tax=Durio zibethinus TaxID=66656 RepID=A0A6P5XB19_DURZI|nr:thionin-like protein 2 [Durio zibethinus]